MSIPRRLVESRPEPTRPHGSPQRSRRAHLDTLMDRFARRWRSPAGWGRRAEAMLPEVCVRLSRALRAGQSPEVAFDEVAGQVAPLPEGVVQVAVESRTGRPLAAAVEEWIGEAECGAERLLSSALHIGVQRGGELATTLDVVGGGLRDDLELDARRRVLLVQAVTSAAVLVALPVVFAVVASLLRGGFVFHGTLGVGLVVLGLGLDALGCVWMRSLMRGLR